MCSTPSCSDCIGKQQRETDPLLDAAKKINVQIEPPSVPSWIFSKTFIQIYQHKISNGFTSASPEDYHDEYKSIEQFMAA